MATKRSVLTYSKADLARHFQVPESTIRFYCGRFDAFLPGTGVGRKRRYLPAALDVLAFIRERLPKERTSAAMEDLLARTFPRLPEHKAQVVTVWPESSIPGRFAQCLPPHNGGEPSAMALPAALSPASAAALKLLEKQGSALERIADSLDMLAGKMNPPQAGLSSATDPRWEQLRGEVDSLRGLLATAEKVQQQDLDQLRAWIMRLAKKE